MEMEVMGITLSFWGDLTEGERKRAERNLAKWQYEEEKFRAACELDGVEEVLWRTPDDYEYKAGVTNMWDLGRTKAQDGEFYGLGSAFNEWCGGMFTDEGYIYRNQSE